MFGFDEEQIAWFGMAAFVGYMFFVIWQLARE